MADFKYTKNELTAQKTKLGQLNKYLPSLKLKKVILQTQINQAIEEIQHLEKIYTAYFHKVEEFSIVFSDWKASSLAESLEIDKKLINYENIAGIEIPYLDGLKFHESDRLIYSDSVWVQSGIWHLRLLKEHFERLETAKEKKRILQKELRVVSIRINLFEKVLIPKIEGIINKIKVFLQDQELQMVGQAKVAKAKLLKKRCFV